MRRPEEGVARVVGEDLAPGAVGDLGVRAGVAHEPDGAQVEHGGATALANGGQRLGDHGQQRVRVGAVDLPVRQAGEALERSRRPPPGDLVLIPIPLSSHTNRTGHGISRCTR